MDTTVELAALDLHYETYRLRDAAREARLLASIAERGVEVPLKGIDPSDGRRLLLDGFKRYRCAKKLGIHSVPYAALADDEAAGIIALMRASTAKPLSVLEQARFVADLLDIHQMSLADVAETLGRSKAWVSMRRGLLAEMPPGVRQLIFRGKFSLYCYLYTLRRFMRMKSVSQAAAERFVRCVAGKRLSVRDIERLAQAYFAGGDGLRQAIEEGKLGWSLDQLRSADDQAGCGPFERGLLRDLHIVAKYLQRVMSKSDDPRLASGAFYAQANLLLANLLSSLPIFHERIRCLHDRSRPA